MNVREIGRVVLVGLYFERPARDTSLADFALELEAAGRFITWWIGRASPRAASVRQLRHVIGIERWGQRRLRVVLGEPPTRDDYDEYRPPADADWDTLRHAWATTRRDTITLVHELARHPIDDVRILHNGLGPLTVRGWLRYILLHANHESLSVL